MADATEEQFAVLARKAADPSNHDPTDFKQALQNL